MKLRAIHQRLRCPKPDQVQRGESFLSAAAVASASCADSRLQGKAPKRRLEFKDGPFFADRWRIDGSPATRVETLEDVSLF